MDPHQTFKIGQRWASETQPELGLGVIEKAGSGRVTVYFAAADERLTYASGSAPLRRVTFEVGEKVRAIGGTEFAVAAVEIDEQRGLRTYVGEGGQRLPEGDLAASSSGSRPEARLKAGRPDVNRLFELRQTMLEHREALGGRGVAGFVGGRISLVPHQLWIASEVATRFAPRVLLADEVGLGKTIEACLILHRLILTGRAERVLILVPDALVHQWFVELLRRFELKFSLFDEERCRAIEGSEGSRNANTFYEEQYVLAPISWLVGSDYRQRQAMEARWDLLIVDEAHHLEWSIAGKPSEAYQFVSIMADRIPGVLLLTATPEQLGVEGHFGRLRLLDPERFTDFGEFQEESANFRELSPIADGLLSGAPLGDGQVEQLMRLVDPAEVLGLVADDTPAARRAVVRSLVDLHGTGRVFFRNRRASLSGFPERRVALVALAAGEAAKVDWLVEFIRADDGRKLLVILETREGAEALGEAVRERVQVKTALFHEGLTLIQRDRAAAWFAEPDGARLMICSEIGSEGRNFQFCHHLVLFDLPGEPDLLEQRIGRLDRIGQTETVKILVPYVTGTAEELLARWYHEGLAAFEHPLSGGRACAEKFGERLATCPKSKWKALIRETLAFRKEIEGELEQGRDHLLELSSFDREGAEAIVAAIAEQDADPALEAFVLQLCDLLGVHVEDHEGRSYFLRPDRVFSEDSFAGLPPEGATVTFDRQRALEREDVTFLTWDHPMVLGVIEQLLGGESGNCGFVNPAEGSGGGLALEVVSVLESLAPKKRHADRYLPPSVVRVCVDHSGAEVDLPEGEFVDAEVSLLAGQAGTLAQLLPPMMESAAAAAERIADGLRSAALRKMASQLHGEVARLKALADAGHPVRASEIRAAEREASALESDLAGARLRVDSVRLIVG